VKSPVYLLFTFLACLSWGRFVQAQTYEEYKAEIVQHVVEPCLEYRVSQQDPIEGLTQDEMLVLLKVTARDYVQEIIDGVLPAVKGKPVQDRMRTYESSRQVWGCQIGRMGGTARPRGRSGPAH